MPKKYALMLFRYACFSVAGYVTYLGVFFVLFIFGYALENDYYKPIEFLTVLCAMLIPVFISMKLETPIINYLVFSATFVYFYTSMVIIYTENEPYSTYGNSGQLEIFPIILNNNYGLGTVIVATIIGVCVSVFKAYWHNK